MTSDLVKDPFIVYALVELFKDVYPTASDGVTRLASAVFGIIVTALMVWTPGMAWREYVVLTLSQGLAVATAATLGHAGVKAIGPSSTPTVEQTAEKIARVTKATATKEITAEKVEEAKAPGPKAPAPVAVTPQRVDGAPPPKPGSVL